MKTSMIKSMMLIGLMSVSTVMMGNTTTNSDVKNKKHMVEHNDKKCKKNGHCSKTCKCMCHKDHWMGGMDMNMDGHKTDNKGSKGHNDMMETNTGKMDKGNTMNTGHENNMNMNNNDKKNDKNNNSTKDNKNNNTNTNNKDNGKDGGNSKSMNTGNSDKGNTNKGNNTNNGNSSVRGNRK